MTPDQEALVEALRAVKRRGIVPDDTLDDLVENCLAYYLCDPAFASQRANPTPTSGGALVLALAAERDLWRLRCEWQEAIVEQLRVEASVHETMSDDGSFATFTSKRNRLAFSVRKADAAKAAYVAAGGTP